MYDSKKHSRRSIRLKNYDYSQPGHYFVTVCVYQRFHLFGDIINREMILNKFGKIAEFEWLRTSELRKNVRLDEFVVMPNHIHGIIIITDEKNEPEGRGVWLYAPTQQKSNNNRKFRSPSKDLGAIVRGYKSTVTKQINEWNNQRGDKIWQRNYYERIIRNQKELDHVREYIRNNPQNWDNDKLK